jgi:2-dehydro-3-deoxygalactonokinase
MTNQDPLRRIIVDWGTSNFRAWRFGRDGAISDRHQAAAGIGTVKDQAFEAVLEREIGAWIAPESEVLLSGMITSRNGWVETPYAEAPATLGDLAAGALTRRSARGATLRFLPGVCVRKPSPDVMRGEEIQIFGSVGPGESATIVLPGTHSKWANVAKGAILGFRTFLTGEIYALLAAHSIVGRLIPPGERPFNESAFLGGVGQARQDGVAGLLNDVFTARSGALLGVFGPEEIADRLSGMLIGHEIKAGLAASGGRGERLLLVGESALVARYRLALRAFGTVAEAGPPDAVVEGFRRLSALKGAWT